MQRSCLAVLLAVLLLLAGGAQAKPKACKAYNVSVGTFFGKIRPYCMPGFSLNCSSQCRKHLKKVNLACFSAIIKERMPERLSGSIAFYKSCAY